MLRCGREPFVVRNRDAGDLLVADLAFLEQSTAGPPVNRLMAVVKPNSRSLRSLRIWRETHAPQG